MRKITSTRAGSPVIWVASAMAVAAVVAVILLTVFADHWRVAAVEQILLSPWLGPAYLGDGGRAEDLLLCNPMGLATGRHGELLISDRGRGRRGRVVWRIEAGGTAHIVAGSGLRGKATETAALAMRFARPEGLAVAADGSVYVSDGFNHAIYRVAPGGAVTRIAGTGERGYGGDGGDATAAVFFRPADIRLDSRGNLFVADVRNHRVRRIDTNGRITTVAGTGEQGFSPDGTPASQARLDTPWGIAVDSRDRLIVADGANHRVRRVDTDGRLVTIAGSGRRGFDGDGGLAIRASLNFPEGLAFDSHERLYIGDELNHAVRLVDTDGTISTVIGTGKPGRGRIGENSQNFAVDDPENVIVTRSGELVITDGNNGRVLRISADGIVHHLAGEGNTERCSSRW